MSKAVGIFVCYSRKVQSKRVSCLRAKGCVLVLASWTGAWWLIFWNSFCNLLRLIWQLNWEGHVFGVAVANIIHFERPQNPVGAVECVSGAQLGLLEPRSGGLEALDILVDCEFESGPGGCNRTVFRSFTELEVERQNAASRARLKRFPQLVVRYECL